jgi:hypothetical protein
MFVSGEEFESSLSVLLVFVLGKHTFDGFFDDFTRVFGQKLLKRNFFETAGKTGVTIVDFVGEFFTGDFDFLRVYSDNVVSLIKVRTGKGFTFAHEEFGDLSRDSTKNLAIKIY